MHLLIGMKTGINHFPVNVDTNKTFDEIVNDIWEIEIVIISNDISFRVDDILYIRLDI